MRRRAAAFAAILVLLAPVESVRALPTGAQVVAGQAAVSTSTPTGMTVTQTSSKAVIDWAGFNIGAAESVRFLQPGASAVALNRVTGADPSAIYGSLSANGQVFLVNPNGVLFGPTARVDVGGLVASSLGITNADFLAGRLNFASGGSAGAVSNQGRLTAAPGGYVALLAPVVTNAATITANGGTAALAAGDKLTLDFDGDNLMKVKVDASALNAQIANSGVIIADGGRVSLTARAAGNLMGGAINDSGAIRATSMVRRNGEIVLDGGSVAVSGTLDVSGTGPNSGGGSIGVFGRDIALKGASVDASGASGGGSVRVGGDLHGAATQAAGNPVVNAQSVVMDAGSVIKADAKDKGDGGRVVLWSEASTRFDGAISAKGGATGGDGGFVETSSRQLLDFRGRVDTSAARGRTGTLLLDPSDITISTGADASISAGPTFSGTANSSTLNTTTLQTALAGNNVIVDTTSGSAGTGNITVSNAVTWASANSLTLKAHNDITLSNVGATINATGAGALNLIADQDASGAGNVTLNNAALTAHSGGIAISGVGVTGVGTITTTGLASGDGGAVSITATGAVSLWDIVANGGTAGAGTAGRAAGNVTISGVGVSTLAITANGSAAATAGSNMAGGAGGAVSITSTNGVTTTTIGASGGAAATTDAAGGNAGSIKIDNSGVGSVATSTLTANTGAAAGTGAGGSVGAAVCGLVTAAVCVTNTAGSIQTASITTIGGASGNGGNVVLDASGSVTTIAGNDIRARAGALATGSSAQGTDGGNVTIRGSTVTMNSPGPYGISTYGGDALTLSGARGGHGGTVSVTATAGAINLGTGVINSSGGAAVAGNGAGGDAKNVTLSATGDVTAGSITMSSGNAFDSGAGGAAATLSVSGANLSLASINANGGSNGQGGSVVLNASGTVTTISGSNIITRGGTPAAGASLAGADAGNVTISGTAITMVAPGGSGISAYGGDAKTLANAKGGSGGVVSLTATAGAINLSTGVVNASGGSAVAGDGAGGDAKNITLSATGDVSTTGTITASSGNAFGAGAGGAAATVSISGANLALGSVTSSGGNNGKGGNIALTGSGTVSTGSGATITARGGTAATGASLAGADAGNVTISGTAITMTSPGGSGITASGGSAQTLANAKGGNGGAISLTASAGAINLGTGVVNTSGGSAVAGAGAGGDAKNLTLSATGNVTAGNITASSGSAFGSGAGGAAATLSVSGANLALGSVTTSGGNNGNGGDIVLNASGTVTISSANTINARGGTAATGASVAGADAGNVTISGTAITMVSPGNSGISATGSDAKTLANAKGGNGGAVSVTASAGAIDLGNVYTSGGSAVAGDGAGGDAKNLTLSATGNVTAGSLTASSGSATGSGAGGAAATLSVSGANLSVNYLTTSGGSNGKGGDIVLNASGTVTTALGATIAARGGTPAAGASVAGADAGNITISGTAITMTSPGASGISAYGGDALGLADAKGGNGGVVSLTSTAGAINLATAPINSSGGDAVAGDGVGGDAKNITLNPNGANVTVGSVSMVAGSGYGSGAGGAPATLSITGANLALGSIAASGGYNANGGTVVLNATGAISTTIDSTIVTSGGAPATGASRQGADAGDVTISGTSVTMTRSVANGTLISANGGDARTLADARGGHAGTIAVTASTGAINFTGGALSATGGSAVAGNGDGGDAKNVTLSAPGDITTGSLSARSGNAKGTGLGGAAATLSVSGANLSLGGTVTNPIITAGGNNGNGGSVVMNATGAFTVAVDSTIQTYGGAPATGASMAGTDAGNITINATSISMSRSVANGTLISAYGGNAQTLADARGGNGGTVAMTASSGAVTVGGAVSTVGGNAVAGNGNGGAGGAITLDAGGGSPTITLGGSLSTTGGNRFGAGVAGAGGKIWIKDPALLSSAVIATGTGGSAGVGTGGDVQFDGTVNSTGGNFALTANTNGTTLFGGALGGSSALASLTTNATGSTQFNGGGVTTTGAQTYSDAVSLGAPASFSSSGGTITVASTLAAGANALTLSADTITLSGGANSITGSSTVTLQPSADNKSVGVAGGAGTLQVSTTNLAALADGFSGIVIGRAGGTAATTVSARTFTDPVTIQQGGVGGTIVMNGAITGTGDASATLSAPGGITFNGVGVDTSAANKSVSVNGPATLATGAVTFTAGSGDVSFSSTIDGAKALTVNSTGTTTFGGAVGGTTPLTSIVTNAGGATQINGGVMSTSTTQTYGDTVTLGANTVFTGTTGSFTGAIQGANNDLTLNFSGTTTVDANTFANVVNFATGNGGTTNLTGNINTSGTQTYNDAVSLTGATVLTSTGVGAAGNIQFANTVDGAQTLAVNSAGASIFGGIVGGTTPLSSLATDAAGTASLGANITTTNGLVSFGDNLTLTGASIINAGNAAISFGGTVNGGFALTANTTGVTTFTGAVGTVTPLASLTTNALGGTQVDGGAVATSGAQSYGDTLTLGAGTVLTGTTGSFTGVIAGGGNDLTLNFSGLTTVDATTFANVANFATGGGGTTQLSGAITTSGSQTYNDAVSLSGPTTLTSSGGSNIRFASTLDGAQTLALDTLGTKSFGGVIGGGTPLTSITTNAGGGTAIDGGAVTTSSAQSYGDTLTLGANAVLTGASGSFTGTIAGASHDLTLNFSGTTTVDANTFANVVNFATGGGGTTNLTGNISTSGTQTYNDAVSLTGGTTLTSTGVGAAGNIQFANTVNGAQTLAVNTAGATTFGGIVGGTTPLTSLMTDAGGSTAINGGAITTSGDQSYGDALTTGGITTLTASSGALSASSTVTATAGKLTLAADATKDIAFSTAGNDFGTVAVASGRNASLKDTNGLILDASSVAGTFTAVAAGNITLNGNLGAGGAGDAIVLAAGGNFSNAGGYTLTPGTGRYLVCSTNPALDNRGGLAYGFKQYNATYGVTAVADAAQNGFLYSLAPSITFSLVDGGATPSKTYDGTKTATVVAANYNAGAVDGDTVAFSVAATEYIDKNVGVGKRIDATGMAITGVTNGGATVYGYTLASNSATGNIGTITAKSLTATVAAPDKTYDSTTTATPTLTVTAGLVGTETVGATGTASFNTKDVATANLVTVDTTSLADGTNGGLAANYSLAAGQTVAAHITKATAALAASKTYDGGVNFASAKITVSGVGGETLGLGGAGPATANSKDVADNATNYLTGMGGMTLADGTGLAANYQLPSLAARSANNTVTIAAAGVQLLDLSGTKSYDGTPDFAFGQLSIAPASVLGSDQVSLASGSATVASRNVGHYAAFTANTLGLGGADAANYSAVGGAVSVDITKRNVTLTAPVISKVYDGLLTYTATAGNLTTLSGSLVGGDTVTAATLAYTDKNAGAGNRTVNLNAATISDGNGGNNYNPTLASNATSSISAKPVTLTAPSVTKVYDGLLSYNTTAADLTAIGNSGALVAGDAVSASTIAYLDKNVGLGNKTVTLSGVGLRDLLNADMSGNYTITANGNATSSITAAPVVPIVVPSSTGLTGSFSAANKVYDGTTAATILARYLAGVIGNDDVQLVGGVANFADKNVGVGKLVTATGLSLAGSAAGNYTANSTATTTADITARPLSITADAKAKVYGDADPAFTYLTGGMGLVAGDALSGALARNPGESVGPYAINQGSLTAGNNYAIAYSRSQLAVTPAQLLYLADPASRFVGQANPHFSGTATGFRLGDTQASATTGILAFDSPATQGSPAGAYAIDGSGLAAGNYVFAQAPANATALTVRASPPPVESPPVVSPPAVAPPKTTPPTTTTPQTTPPVNPPSTATPLPTQATVADIFPLERLLDPLVPCKNKLVQNKDGSISIKADCGG